MTCETYSTGDLSYVPQCDENGNFNTTQCEEDMCFCVDKMSGNILEGTRRPIEIFNLECSLLGGKLYSCKITHDVHGVPSDKQCL